MKVDFSKHPWDAKVKKLANTFYAGAVAKHCDLSVGQVRYRIKVAGMSPRLFRSGLTPEARELIREIDSELRAIKTFLRSTKRLIGSSDRRRHTARRRQHAKRK